MIYIIQLLLQLQLTVTYFSVILLFQLQLQLTEGTLISGSSQPQCFLQEQCPCYCGRYGDIWQPDLASCLRTKTAV